MINFNRGVIDDGKTTYIVRLHTTDALAIAKDNTPANYIEGTFYARSEVDNKRLTAEKSMYYDGTGLVEINRNISIQKSIVLRSGLIRTDDVDAQTFLDRLLRRGALNIKKSTDSTFQVGYCTTDVIKTMEGLNLYKYDFTIVFGQVEEVTI